MKRSILTTMLAVLLLTVSTQGAMTYTASAILKNAQNVTMNNQYMNPLYLFANEVEGYIEGTTGFNPINLRGVAYTPPAADGTNGQVLSTNGSKVLSWVANAGTFAGGDVTGDIHMANGIYIKSETGAGNASAIQVRDDDAATFRNALSWTNGNTPAVVLGAAQDSVAITSTGFNVTTGGVVTGVSTLAASGLITATGGLSLGTTLTLESGETITNATNTEIAFSDGSEDLILDMDAAANTVGLKSSTGVSGIALGDVDDLSGVGTIAFDAAAASMTTATSGDAQDLTVGITGATNSSLILTSSGTGADALQITSTAGGIDITVSGAAANEDIDITTNSSVNITSTEGAANAIKLLTNGGASETIVATNTQGTGEAAITLTATAGGIDIDAATGKNIDVQGGQILLTSNENVANAIKLLTNTGVSETIVATNTQGTGAGAITLTATAGGVDIDAAAAKDVDIQGGQVLLTALDNAANAIKLLTNAGTTETIVVTNTQGTAEGAITLTSTAGGVDVDAAAGKNVDIQGGQVLVTGLDNAANAIKLYTNTGISETIVVTNNAGTGNGALTLSSTAGGVDVDAAAAKPLALAGGSVTIDSKTAGAGAVAVTVNQGATDTITVTNSQGTGTGAITLTSSAGGITLSSGRVTIDEGEFHLDTVELSNADIKALRGSPKTLIAAPGANYFIEVISAVLILDYGSNVLTETTDNLVIEYANGQDITAAIETTGWLDQAGDVLQFVPAAAIATATKANISNNLVRLFNTGDGEFGGNAGNDTTMTVKITYRVWADGL